MTAQSPPRHAPSGLSSTWFLSAIRLPRDFLHSYGIVISLVLLVALVTVTDPAFLSLTNIANMLGQWAPAGIMAVAMTYVVIARGFDLSLASGFSLCAITAATIAAQGSGIPLAFAAALSVGIAIGCFNALLVCGLSINPFIATVGTGFILLGLDIITTPNTYITVEQAGFDRLGAGTWHGMYYKGILLIAFLIAGEFVLAKTRFGQYLYAIGGNPEASRFSGLYVRTLTGLTYIFSGFTMGVAGILAASQFSSAGGFGAIWRTAVGLAIIATISNGFTLLGLNPFYQSIVKGTVIILAVAFEGWARRLAAAALAKEIATEATPSGMDERTSA